MVGVDHLDLGAEALDAAADDAQLAHRQRLVQVVLARVEEHQIKLPGIVGATHLVGEAPGGRRKVRVDAYGDGGDTAARRLGDLGRETAVDQPAGQVPQEVGNPRPGDSGDELADAGTDAAKRRDLGEQGKQDIGAHRTTTMG